MVDYATESVDVKTGESPTELDLFVTFGDFRANQHAMLESLESLISQVGCPDALLKYGTSDYPDISFVRTLRVIEDLTGSFSAVTSALIDKLEKLNIP